MDQQIQIQQQIKLKKKEEGNNHFTVADENHSNTKERLSNITNKLTHRINNDKNYKKR